MNSQIFSVEMLLKDLSDFWHSNTSSNKFDLINVFDFESSFFECCIDWLGYLFKKFLCALLNLLSLEINLKSDIVQKLWDFDVLVLVGTECLLDLDGILKKSLDSSDIFTNIWLSCSFGKCIELIGKKVHNDNIKVFGT